MIYKILRKIFYYKRRINSILFFSLKKFFLPTTIFFNSPPSTVQKLTILGKGTIEFGLDVALGVYPSPNRNGDFYLEARGCSAKIEIGDNVYINNSAVIIADKSTITIGKNTLIGPNFTCFDSNFHSLNPKKRLSSDYKCKPVIIGENVFIGANVTILRGTVIGDDSVIGAGCVVSGLVPPKSVLSASNNYQITKLNCE